MKFVLAALVGAAMGSLTTIVLFALIDRWVLAFTTLLWIGGVLAMTGVGGVMGWGLGRRLEDARLRRKLAAMDEELERDG